MARKATLKSSTRIPAGSEHTVTVSAELTKARDEYTLRCGEFRAADSQVQEDMKAKNEKLRLVYLAGAKMAHLDPTFSAEQWVVDYYGNERLAKMNSNVRDKSKSQLKSIIDASRTNYDMVIAAWPPRGADGKSTSNQGKFIANMTAIKNNPQLQTMDAVNQARLAKKKEEEKAAAPTPDKVASSFASVMKGFVIPTTQGEYDAMITAVAAFVAAADAAHKAAIADAQRRTALLQNNTAGVIAPAP